MNPFTETVEVIARRQSCLKFNELVLVDDFCVLGGENNVSGRFPRDFEPKRRFITPYKMSITAMP